MRLLPVLQVFGFLFVHGVAVTSGQVVTNSASSGPGSFSEVVASAAEGSTVTFAPALSGVTIVCTNSIAINKALTIDGSDLAEAPRIGFTNLQKFIEVGGSVTVANLEIRNNSGPSDAVAISVGSGGKFVGQNLMVLGDGHWAPLGHAMGIKVVTNATAVLSDCRFFSHSGNGGVNEGSLSATNCSFSGNGGWGVINAVSSVADLENCTVANNGNYGGGIHNAGTLTLNGGSVTNNDNWQGENAYEGESGGGIWNGETASLTISNTVVSLNRSFTGGGINNQGKVVADNVRIEGNNYPNQTLPYGYGAGIWSAKGDISLVDCAVVGNQSSDNGGIYKMAGDLTLIRTVISSNLSVALPSVNTDCQGGVGAAIVSASGRVKLIDCTVSGNQSPGLFCLSPDGNPSSVPGGPGGLRVTGDLEIYRSTISSNVGNAISHSGGTATIVQSTIVGNNQFGGILSLAVLRMTNCTVFGNRATSPNANGGGIYSKGTEFSLQNSIVCSNQADLNPDIFGTFSGDHNLVGVDPGLAVLGNNGGLTATMAPLAGSAAIDAGAFVGFATDQRGFPGLVSLFPDVGAVESGFLKPVQFTAQFDGAGNLTIRFRAAAGATFRIYTTGGLGGGVSETFGNWELVGNAVEVAEAGMFMFTFASGGGQERYFAIVPSVL